MSSMLWSHRKRARNCKASHSDTMKSLRCKYRGLYNKLFVIMSMKFLFDSSFFGLILALMIMSTLYDIFQANQESKLDDLFLYLNAQVALNGTFFSLQRRKMKFLRHFLFINMARKYWAASEAVHQTFCIVCMAFGLCPRCGFCIVTRILCLAWHPLWTIAVWKR